MALQLDHPKPRSRYVAVCDVLGFKSRLLNTPLAELAYRYLRFLVRTRLHALTVGALPAGMHPEEFISFSVFSDTFLVWSAPMSLHVKALDLGPTSFFFDMCNLLVRLGLEADMPLRIGIAYGDVCIEPNHSLYVGQPIADAYLLQESQNWIGGACHSSCSAAPTFCYADEVWHDVVDYPVPTKTGPVLMPALDWPAWAIDHRPETLLKSTALPSDLQDATSISTH